MSHDLFLNTLNLKNFATFDDQTIDFSSGFNIIAGETGSGKSLILDALCILSGARADKNLIRKDNDHLVIEAVFSTNNQDLHEYFEKIGYPIVENEIIVKRIIYTNGKNKNYLNFCLCRLGEIIDFSKRFIDLVGQFENQKLLSPKYQLVLLDKFGGLNNLTNDFKIEFNHYVLLLEKLNSKVLEFEDYKKNIEYIDYQINELESLNPSEDDEQKLLNIKNHLLNSEKRERLISDLNFLSNSDEGIQSLFSKFSKLLRSNSNVLSSNLSDTFDEIQGLFSDLMHELNNNNLDLNFDDDINFVINRLDGYQKIKSKFKCSTHDLIQKLSDLKNYREKFNFSENLIFDLERQIETCLKNLKIKADHLHLKRLDASLKLSKILTNEIQSLNMLGATINFNVIKNNNLSIAGFDEINIEIETNKGEGFYYLKKIASGGELSRILLALRKVLSSNDTISIFLFDEIDAGIGGETGNKIGQSLDEVSKFSQVIAISHLPQVAQYAQKIIHVTKEYNPNSSRTISKATEIDDTSDIKNFALKMSMLDIENSAHLQ
jgi:DNA repair protein RecN (Recombination protein N)